MISPFEIFLDARMALCDSQEWGAGLSYPQPIHLAYTIIERANLHLGIRAIDGYMGDRSVTDRLMAKLDEVAA